MCFDPQHLGSKEHGVIEIEPHDGNFEGLEIGWNGRYSQIRDIWISEIPIFFTKTTPTPMPTKPDILKVIPVFHIKKFWDSTYQAYAMMGHFQKCGICQPDFSHSVSISRIPHSQRLFKLWQKSKQTSLYNFINHHLTSKCISRR